ncbi:MAG TPA: carboxypeptidase regulatory-like domain-containing protein [Gemmatimonadaceae bacterium]|nr:carboxypeptidase regulatory-like domain-containing protein [Gemmatimonadaceae bacterium]
MPIRRLKGSIVAIGALLLASLGTDALAQGITTGAISGFVTDSAGNGIVGAQIQISNRATGSSTRTSSREGGRYLVQGLEVGGPYTIVARLIGFNPETRENVTVGLTQNVRADFRLSARATTLATVEVRSAIDVSPSSAGTRTIISDSVLRRIPSLNRNLADFVNIAPQVSSSGPGYSAGGMSNRMNNVQLDGATERDVFGLGTTGQPGAQTNSKSISIDAVKELQILLAPFDVRQGNFGGLLLNVVTKNGTNDVTGTAYTFYRNQNYGRNVPTLRAAPYVNKSYGFTLGGPIVKDRLHFFVAPEWKKESSPISGPYLGQPASATVPFAADSATLLRFENAFRTHNAEPGTPGAVTGENPVSNFFGRLDMRFNESHRAVFHYNYGIGQLPSRLENFRSASAIVYTSNFHDYTQTKHAPVLQLFSSFSNGSFNELFLGYNRVRDRRVPPTQFPQVQITVPRTGGGTASIFAGADASSMVNELDTDTYEITDNYTKPFGNHTVTVGTRNELVKLRNQFLQNSFGVWTFTSLANFETGTAGTFRRAIILRDSGNVYFDALQTALYAQDQWQVSQKFGVTLGLRADISSFLTDIPYFAPIDSAYGRRTDDIPKRSVQFSPRVGWNYDITGNQANIFRGGLGLFVGVPPYVWLENAYINNGLILANLSCGGSVPNPAPKFSVDPNVYNTCADGGGSQPVGTVNFLDESLKFPQPMRLTVGFDKVLRGNVVATVEGLFSKTLNQFFFVNRNLRSTPRGVDLHGRPLYGDTILTNGVARPSLPDAVRVNGGLARFGTAVDLINQSQDFAYNLTAQLRKRYAGNWEGSAAYTYSKARDVQSFASSTHLSNFSFGRTTAGDIFDPYTSISLFDQPHKISMNGTYTFRWLKNFSTDLSASYFGVSGAPHDYIYDRGASTGSGDLNADGTQGNDLIYVPTDARLPSEILFTNSGSGASLVTAVAQAEAFEKFIENSPCLSRQRGQILERNSCRLPFFNNFNVSVRQSVPTLSGQSLSVQFDIFNFGNLLNKNWGKVQITQASTRNNVPILQHSGQTGIDPKTAQSTFNFNVNTKEYVVGDLVSSYWRSQLSVRYSF